MKLTLTAFAALIVALLAFSASAQTTAPPVAAPQAVPIKIAVIDTQAFGDPKTGIKRLLNAFGQLDTEFKPRRDELTTLQTRYQTLAKEVQDLQKSPSPNQQLLSDKIDQGQTLENEIKRKQEDAQKAFERRNRQLTDPINTDIAKAIEVYARQKGYDIVIDAAKFAGTMILINKGIDITDAFIADYNGRNPAAATPTRP
jgi:outer membrane protein